MSWYKVTLTGDIAKRHCWNFAQQVMEYHMKILTDATVPRPSSRAFVYRLKGTSADECTYYFSPDAAASYKELIVHYAGEPCAKPSASEVEQSIGGQDATKFLSE